MRTISSVIIPLVLLAGCDRSGRADADRSVHIAMDRDNGGNHLSVDIPGLDARVALPALDLGRHVDLDGIRLAPDTQVRDIAVSDAARDATGSAEASDGQVVLRFTSPRAPAALLDYYRRSAAAAGYDSISATGDGLVATRRNKRFALALSPQGSGSAGSITVNGSDG